MAKTSKKRSGAKRRTARKTKAKKTVAKKAKKAASKAASRPRRKVSRVTAPRPADRLVPTHRTEIALPMPMSTSAPIRPEGYRVSPALYKEAPLLPEKK